MSAAPCSADFAKKLVWEMLMNRQKTAILIDSGCDIPSKIRKEYEIEILPLHVIYPERDYQDGVDINPTMVYQRFPEEFPSTSTPSIMEVRDKFDELRVMGYEKIIAITISSNLSGTFNAVRLAAQEYEEEEETIRIFPFDTRNISIGSGLFAIWAALQLRKGRTFEEICAALPEKLSDSKVFFYMDTLKYLQRGGRIGRVAGTVGSLLQLKPIISCDENGEYYTVAKIRGARLAKLKLGEEVVKYGIGHKTWMVVEEGDAHEEAVAMQNMLNSHERLVDKQILYEGQITASMAVNTGPGLVGVAVFRDPD